MRPNFEDITLSMYRGTQVDATITTIFGRVVYSHRLRGLFLSALKVELVTYDAFKN